MGGEDAKKEIKESRGSTNIARQEKGQNGRDGTSPTGVHGGEQTVDERGGEFEGVERALAQRERCVTQRGGGADRRGGPRTGRVSSAEGRAPAGDPRGAHAADDVAPLADILAHLDSEEYLDSLHQLADSLLQEIGASVAGAAEHVSDRKTGECPEGAQVVGTAAEHLESGEGAVVDIKHDVDRILSQHSYAHPYAPDIVVTEPKEIVQIKQENENDKGDIFYASFDEANDCITVEVPCEDQVEEVAPIHVDTEFKLATDEFKLENEMKMLSPMSLSPSSADENFLGLSPAHTSLSSDLGYESLASPLSEPESLDLSEFWCESFSELFPGLA